jgi:hypothetical protein
MARRLLIALLLASPLLTSCVVREERVARPGACPGGVWIEPHDGPRGRWHPGHWRCPGRREVIEVE